MKDFVYIIIGGGCAGLSLAYELEINKKLENKTLAIIEPRDEYKRDKTWSFWKTISHNFDDCVKKSWKYFSINIPNKTKHLECNDYPYQTIDSGLFYEKINSKLKQNKNINFFKNPKGINLSKGVVFNSVPTFTHHSVEGLWQRFCGFEIETKNNIFDEKIFNLMDFDCEQKNSVHFFYTLPFSKNRALIESTWLSKLNDKTLEDYDNQIKSYIENKLNIKDYNIIYKEIGDIPLFPHTFIRENNEIKIGSAGGMTRLSTGYTFLNIQEHCKFIRENIENINKMKTFEIQKKYQFLDNLFLTVLQKHSKKMPDIFFNMFKGSSNTTIKFLSNKSNILEDFSIILRMPKWVFVKVLLKRLWGV